MQEEAPRRQDSNLHRQVDSRSLYLSSYSGDATKQTPAGRPRTASSVDGLSLPRSCYSSAPSQSNAWPLTSIAGIWRLGSSREAGFQTPQERR